MDERLSIFCLRLLRKSFFEVFGVSFWKAFDLDVKMECVVLSVHFFVFEVDLLKSIFSKSIIKDAHLSVKWGPKSRRFFCGTSVMTSGCQNKIPPHEPLFSKPRRRNFFPQMMKGVRGAKSPEKIFWELGGFSVIFLWELYHLNW